MPFNASLPHKQSSTIELRGMTVNNFEVARRSSVLGKWQAEFHLA